MRVPFHIGRPQIFAGLLLLIFAAQSSWLVVYLPLDEDQEATGAVGRVLYDPSMSTAFFGEVSEGIIPLRIAGIVLAGRDAVAPAYGEPSTQNSHLDGAYSNILFNNRLNQKLVRLPFLLCGVWLGGAIWWVARRLYGDAGGYVALSLFAFSPLFIGYSANAGPEIVAAWAIFGVIFTAMGVGHTLYAPPRKWYPRAGLLGIALAVSLGSSFALWIVLPLALALMSYLAPGRTRAALSAISLSSILAAVILWACYGFHGGALEATLWRGVTLNDRRPGFWLIGEYFSTPVLLLLLVYSLLFLAAITTYYFWRRAQYFGNTAPLLAALVLFPVALEVPRTTGVVVAAMAPLLFVFIGGIAADLLETRHKNLVRKMLFAILAANALLSFLAVPRLGSTTFYGLKARTRLYMEPLPGK